MSKTEIVEMLIYCPDCGTFTQHRRIEGGWLCTQCITNTTADTRTGKYDWQRRRLYDEYP